MGDDLISRKYLQNLTCGIIDEDGIIHQVVMLADIDNAPAVDCQSCQYLKFTEQFVENIVKVMIGNGITTIEELKKKIGGAE